MIRNDNGRSTQRRWACIFQGICIFWSDTSSGNDASVTILCFPFFDRLILQVTLLFVIAKKWDDVSKLQNQTNVSYVNIYIRIYIYIYIYIRISVAKKL